MSKKMVYISEVENGYNISLAESTDMDYKERQFIAETPEQVATIMQLFLKGTEEDE